MKYHVVDAFAERVFEGNPAGVCVMDAWLPDDLMQRIAAENNLSETAFTVRVEKKGETGATRDLYHLRWFTPTEEIDLCGHATLATAYVLGRFYDKEAAGFTFTGRSGELVALRRGNMYELNFPSRVAEACSVLNGLDAILGVKSVKETYLSRDLMCVLESEEEIRNLTPDFAKLALVPSGLGLIVTAPASTPGFDFVSRVFFPKIGINEDPVCGSAHCSLIPYWASRLGKNELAARQVSARGGTLHCVLDGDRVRIAGTAVLYSEAEIYVN